ncbi:MAG: U32 family peptidase, partial [Desulfobacterales bacterium]|nr:U32 family peptidase [Desulfobacterales bacterium]
MKHILQKAAPSGVPSVEVVPKPAILAPAGNRASFLAALAAGAEAIYCGLKALSARMEAKNFTIEELAALTRLAHAKGAQVYVTVNSLLAPGDLDTAGRLVDQLQRAVQPDGLIVQDLAMVQLVRQAGFSGQLHLSTLAAVSFPEALRMIGSAGGVDRVVLPRELSIDEIKAMAQACPAGVKLEVFVHGALCYGVSGRCYWSSYFGGKSGLRGRCVQPCRRIYAQTADKRRAFACQDLSLDVLVKPLLSIPQVGAWKIEGRKKGPHYVYYTVQAYRMLRDHGQDPRAKQDALYLLSHALGRTGTHFAFLPQRPQNPVPAAGQTASGLFVGKVGGLKGSLFLVPREALMPGDVLRLGYEDEPWHAIVRVRQHVPAKGRLVLKLPAGQTSAKGAPVFLTDRREKALETQLADLEAELTFPAGVQIAPSDFKAGLPTRTRKRTLALEMGVHRDLRRGDPRIPTGVWLSAESRAGIPRGMWPNVWWWLPPVTWPGEEAELRGLIDTVRQRQARCFVLNTPWQAALFRNLRGVDLWAGPFCNPANPLALQTLAEMGFAGAFVSPELGREDYLQLPRNSPLPLGIVLSGCWPLCVSRFVAD